MATTYTDWMSVLARVEQNDSVALVELSQLVVGWLRRFRAHEQCDSVDDVIQSVILGVLDCHRKQRLRRPEAFVSFVGVMVRNTLINKQRETQRSAPAPHADAALAFALRSTTARDADPEVLTELGKALDGLPERSRRVIEALYLHGETYAEASSTLGLPLGTLKRLQTQALADLREALGVAIHGKAPASAPPRSESSAHATYDSGRATAAAQRQTE